MALKYQIDKLEDVAAPLREHYTAKDGKYHLTLDGGHPDTARVAEFRDTNIGLKKQVDDLTAKFAGIDPEIVKADRAKLIELESAKPNERIATLESQLAESNKRANAVVLRDALDSAFLKAGGRPNAVDLVRAKAADKFEIKDGVVIGTTFDPTKPGEKLTVDTFINQLLSDSSFLFMPSSGGGAAPSRTSGSRSGVKELRNPSPAQLGAAGADIRAGKVRVVYDE